MSKIEKNKLKNILEKLESDDEIERLAALDELSNVPKEQFNTDLKIGVLFSAYETFFDARKEAEKILQALGYASPQDMFNKFSEEEKQKVYDKIKVYANSDYWDKRAMAAQAFSLVPKEVFDKDASLRTTLAPLMCEGFEYVEIPAKEAAKRLGYPFVEQLLNTLSKDEMKIIYNKISEYAASDNLHKYIVAVRLLYQIKQQVEAEQLMLEDDDIEKFVQMVKSSLEKYNAIQATNVLALSLIPKEILEKDEDLRRALLFLMCDPYSDLGVEATKIAQAYECMTPQDMFGTLSKEGKERMLDEALVYSKSGGRLENVVAAKVFSLISTEEFNKKEEGKIALFLLTCYYEERVQKEAKQTAKKHDYPTEQALLESLSDAGRKRLYEDVIEYSKKGDWDRNRIAIKALKVIGEEIKSGKIVLTEDEQTMFVKLAKDCFEAGVSYPKQKELALTTLSFVPAEIFKQDDDFKVGLIFSMNDIDNRIKTLAEKVAQQYNYSSQEQLFKDITNKTKLYNQIITYSESAIKDNREMAAQVFSLVSRKALKQNENLKVALLLLAYDPDKIIEEKANEVMQKLGYPQTAALHNDLTVEGKKELYDKIIKYAEDGTWSKNSIAISALQQIKEQILARKLVVEKAVMEKFTKLLNTFSNSKDEDMRQLAIEAREALNGTHQFPYQSTTSPPDNAFRNKGRKREEIKEKRKRL